MAQHFGQQSDSIEELASVKEPIITLTVIIFSTCLFESSIEDFDSKFVWYHASFDGKLDELSDIHGAIFVTFGLIQLMKSGFFSLFQGYTVVRHFNEFKLKLVFLKNNVDIVFIRNE